ncbi:MAG: hypothetical protein ACJAV6_000022 [Candidatus Paceibacteria bacterium]|jgi:hypothetical protein
MIYKFGKFIFVLTIITGWLFSGWPYIKDFFPSLENVDAAIGDIGHWRDAAGSQIPGTTFAAFNFDSEIQNDGIYTKPTSATLELEEAGDYLIISTIRYNNTTNSQFNPQSRIALTSGTGTIFTSYYTGYSANDTTEDDSWVRSVAVIIGASTDAQLQVQTRLDGGTLTGGSISTASDLQAVRINPTNHGIYAIGGTGQSLGGTTPNTVDITTITAESDTAAIQGDTVTETVTVKGDNKRYLVAWSVSGDSAIDRTQRIGHLEYDGVDELTTRSYCYQRSSATDYCGIGSMDIIETVTADIAIQSEAFRGPGVLADEGGADQDSGFTTDGNGQMVVLELPESLEVFRAHDATGLQDITNIVSTDLNAMRSLDFNDAASFTKSSDIAMDVTNPADIFSWANIWTARNDVAIGSRLIARSSFTINGAEQSTGRHGNYTRGNVIGASTFAGSFHPAGIFTVGTAGHDIGLEIRRLTGGDSGGTDRTQPNTVGFFSLNLDTLLPPVFEQSAYRFFNNADSTDVGAPLAAQDTSATLSSGGGAFRLRTLVHVSDAQLRLNSENFKLQFATKSGTCDTGFSGETYTDVTASTAIAYNDNATPADGDNLTANANDPIHSGHGIVNQAYEELNNISTTVSAIPAGQDGKWDFALVDNTAPAGASYCFRLVASDDSLLDTYTVVPEITTFSVSPGGVSSNLQLWLRADVGVTTSGGAVSTWSDQSGKGNDLAQVLVNKRPMYKDTTELINFNPVIDFDGGASNVNGGDIFSGTASEVDTYIVAQEDKRQGNITFTFFYENGGRISTHYPWKSGIIYWDFGTCCSSATGRLQTTENYVTVGLPSLGRFVNSPLNSKQEIWVNGAIKSADTNALSQTSNQVFLGGLPGESQYSGKIPEFIVYDRDLSAAENNQVQSYIALKYGIPIDQSVSSGGIDYVDTTGTSYWSEDTSDIYEHDIFGVGRDDATLLDQRVSQSEYSDAIITMALDNDFTTPNQDILRTTTHTNDLQFLTLANNNAASTVQTTEIDLLVYAGRIGREWKIQKTANFTQNINMKFSGFDDSYQVIIDADGDFSTGATGLGILSPSGEIAGVDLGDDQYITLAQALDQSLSFSISDNTIGFGSLSAGNSTWANGVGTGSVSATTAHTINASTNASSGYVITVDGPTLTCSNCSGSPIISAIGGISTASNPGTEQFGLRALVSNGTGSVASPYNTANYAFDAAGVPDTVMTGPGDSTPTTFNLEYLADISAVTVPGLYDTTLTYTITPTF